MQGETSSSCGADESSEEEEVAEAPPPRSRRRSARLRNTEKVARPARGARRKAKPPRPSSPEETSSEEDEAPHQGQLPQRRAPPSMSVRRPGRRRSKLIEGGGELSSDDYDDEDINEFIARSDDEEPAESERETSADEEEQPSANEEEEPEKHMASRSRGAGQNRRAAAARTLGAAAKAKQTEKARQVAKQRRLSRAGSGAGSTPQGPPEPQGLEDSSSGDDKSLSARSARLKGKQPAAPEPPDANEPGPSAEHARWRPTQQPIQQPARHAALAAALADDSEEEHEEVEVDLQSLSRGSKRRRLRKASGADVTPVLGAAEAANRPAVRTRTRTLLSKPSILEQLKQHQAAHSKGRGDGKRGQEKSDELIDGDDGLQDYTLSDDDSGGGKGGDFVISDDDEEGGPSASPAGESESEESLQDFIEKDTAEEAGTGPRSAVKSPLEGLGLPYQRPELKASFNLYLDYLLYSLADPEFEAKLEADRHQRQQYLQAVKRIEEEELATWREHYAKSDAWKRAVPGFVPALEHLPGLSVAEGHYEPSLNAHYGEDDEDGVRECAACERLHSRATVELFFKGRPYWPDYKYGTKSLADMAIRADDYDSDLEGEEEELKERSYVVGQHCAVRVQLYHALWHYRRRMRGKLKKQLKKSRQYLENVRKPSSWIDAAVNVTEHSRLYSALFYNFQGLKWAAQNYSQGSTGGGYSRAGASVRKTTEKVTKLLYNLNSDSEGDEGSDIEFSDLEEDEDEGDTGAEAEGEAGPGNHEGSADEDNAEVEEAPAEGAEAVASDEPPEGDFDSRQLNSQPVRRRLLLDDSDDDDVADVSADNTALPRAGAPAATQEPTGEPSNGNDVSAASASAGAGGAAGTAPVAALAAQSAAGVQAALNRAKGGSPNSRTASGRAGAVAAGSGGPGSVSRQRGILSYFSPKKKASS
ncbi:hypothetical protein COCSUDRAFT_64448 [Coccomyxa subellipsoidea C-169]|uniref:DUF4211 domain-containing protein n=1 Tax=Coccomyxa subellipsoidea (strain C-169) TaxID=574566 RepID=I0Z6S7_COCSC|nr:hypothetical protein COCSUDRAFT_64448 [Coccomyxa subellipsoidea C-169]EIE26346.1 hypothetical protein COCSUDRAFT_64448 [Coccomyxa subellipsoidea C-169]|eukprot:XP_005650890.1 hypothetical protein COCSUDRAFT_64448 [Coccomyxa subellipsoidea C-169]